MMRFIITDLGIDIIPEDAQDNAYLKLVLKLDAINSIAEASQYLIPPKKFGVFN